MKFIVFKNEFNLVLSKIPKNSQPKHIFFKTINETKPPTALIFLG